MNFELDCSMGEGGGSIVRIAVALAAAKERDIKLYNIRAKRKNPGLQAQHIEAINAILQLSGGTAKGLYRGSETLSYFTGKNKQNSAVVNVQTAGSIALLSQAVMYYALSRNDKLTLTINGGATHGKWAPSVEYIENVTHQFLKKMKKNISLEVSKYGFYPRGGAACKITYESHKEISNLVILEKGEIKQIHVISVAAKSLKNRKVAERQVNGFLAKIKLPIEPNVNIKYVDSLNPGTGLTIVAEYENSSEGVFVVGEKKLSAETVGQFCAKAWQSQYENDAPVDQFAADQLIVPMAFAEGESKIRIQALTLHTKTNIKLVQKILNTRINISSDGESHIISVLPN